MTNFFGNKVKPMTPRYTLENRYTSSRHNLLLIVAFSVINIVLLLTNANSYFLFSAYIPYFIVALGITVCGKLPPEYYDAEFIFMPDYFLVITVAVAAVIVVLYLLCWIFSNKNRVGWLIAALALFSIDSAAMLLLNGIDLDSLIDIVFHAYVLYSLVVGVVSYFRLKRLPVGEPAAENCNTEAFDSTNIYVEEAQDAEQTEKATDERAE